MRHVAFLLIALVGVSAASPRFARGADPGPPQRMAHFDAMPRLTVLPDGTIAAYFLEVRGPGLGPTPAVQELKCRLSQDNGRTWGNEHSLFTLPAEKGYFGFPAPLVDTAGEMHFFLMGDDNTGMLRHREARPGRPAVEPRPTQRLDIWHVRSTGGRTQWPEPKRIWEGRVSDLQSVIQLKSGRIVLPFGDTVTGRSWSNRGEGVAAFTFFGEFDTHVLYSDDFGQTWQTSRSVLRTPAPNVALSFGAVEPVIVQLSDSRVWMLIRTQTGRLWESFSDDGSEWSPAAPTSILSSDAPAGLVRLPDERLVLIWNNCQRFPYARGGRQVLHAAISADDGKTWRGRREILRDPHRNEPPPPTGDHGVSYTYPIAAPDGRVLYSMWVQTGQGRSIESFDPEWLLQTQASDDFSKGLDGWSTFATKGVEIVSHPDSADRHMLALKKAEADWPAAAVWNFPFSESGSLRMRVRREGAFGGATLMLTDHFSTPLDAEDGYYSLFRAALPAAAAQDDGWAEIEFRWDGAKRACELLVGGKLIETLPQQRESDGPSYLRIRCTATAPEQGRLLVDSVDMTSAAGSSR